MAPCLISDEYFRDCIDGNGTKCVGCLGHGICNTVFTLEVCNNVSQVGSGVGLSVGKSKWCPGALIAKTHLMFLEYFI